MKTCTKCAVEKSESAFYSRGEGKPLMACCKSCMLANNRAWSAKNKERHAALIRRWDKSNPESRRLIEKSYNNRFPEKRKQITRNWRKRNMRVIADHAAYRRARILRATPSWSDRARIKDIYLSCPDGMQVDHVVPLVGRAVCGLHVPENLQYLSAEDNRRKRAQFDVEGIT